MSDTMADDRYYNFLGGDGSESTMDEFDSKFTGDVRKYGWGYAVIKNWGQAGDTAVEAERRHYSATSTETTQDARKRFYADYVEA